jgi:hypothetical protein
VADRLDELGTLLGQSTPLLATTLFYAVAMGVVPALLVGLTAVLSRRWGRLAGSSFDVATRFAFALIPLGFGMWLAHYSFHLITSYDVFIPAAQRFAMDRGWQAPAELAWTCACCRPVPTWLLKLEIAALDVGLLFSLYAGYRIALNRSPRPLLAFAPWGGLMIMLFATGVWIVFQPMQMRGLLPAGG